MKQLILVRHGDYDADGHNGHLNDRGRKKIKILTKKLKKFIKRCSVAILTSTADRARESADMLSSFFGVDHEQYDVLWSGSGHPEDLEGALDLIRWKVRMKNPDVLIVVTHFEYVEDIPSFFAKKELDIELQSITIDKAEALVFDCCQKSLTHVC